LKKGEMVGGEVSELEARKMHSRVQEEVTVSWSDTQLNHNHRAEGRRSVGERRKGGSLRGSPNEQGLVTAGVPKRKEGGRSGVSINGKDSTNEKVQARPSPAEKKGTAGA